MSKLALLTQATVATLMATACLSAYHFLVLPASATRFAVVDVGEVYRLKEKQLVELVSKAGATDADKKHATEMALEFTKSLPAALEQLPRECQCTVLLRAAVAAETGSMRDLTPLLKSKVGV